MHTSPKINHVCFPKLCISIVFYFSRDHCNTEEKSKTKVMQSFGEQKRCIMGDVQMVNRIMLLGLLKINKQACNTGSLVLRKAEE